LLSISRLKTHENGDEEATTNAKNAAANDKEMATERRSRREEPGIRHRGIVARVFAVIALIGR
jgi:hypothetical protein